MKKKGYVLCYGHDRAYPFWARRVRGVMLARSKLPCFCAGLDLQEWSKFNVYTCGDCFFGC